MNNIECPTTPKPVSPKVVLQDSINELMHAMAEQQNLIESCFGMEGGSDCSVKDVPAVGGNILNTLQQGSELVTDVTRRIRATNDILSQNIG